jgi:hypothetical protein
MAGEDNKHEVGKEDLEKKKHVEGEEDLEKKDYPLSPTDWVMLLSTEINREVNSQSTYITIITAFFVALLTVMAGSIYAFLNIINTEFAPMVLPSLIKFWCFNSCVIVVLAILTSIISKGNRKRIECLDKIQRGIISQRLKDFNKIRNRWEKCIAGKKRFLLFY